MFSLVKKCYERTAPLQIGNNFSMFSYLYLISSPRKRRQERFPFVSHDCSVISAVPHSLSAILPTISAAPSFHFRSCSPFRRPFFHRRDQAACELISLPVGPSTPIPQTSEVRCSLPSWPSSQRPHSTFPKLRSRRDARYAFAAA